MAVNSLYCAFWDVEMDWGMPWLLQSGQGPGAGQGTGIKAAA
jgi:hypothetical protein